jgi:hypothetical protein
MLWRVPDPLDASLIQLRCQRPEHRTTGDPTPVFLHLGGWAYCEAGELGTDHANAQDTAPLTIDGISCPMELPRIPGAPLLAIVRLREVELRSAELSDL